ncbi:MAG: hypothetical protein NZM31_02615 [Gemmatales bacterium]|nr:hypothetical protein [Gemmatales bacterium]MDW8385892.1 hypothetical protein [Gemmatales bacterium]
MSSEERKEQQPTPAPATPEATEASAPALPPGQAAGTGPYAEAVGRVDITGIVPEGVHVDPLITEGHVGYEESGESEVIPPQRLAEKPSAPDKGKNG